MLARKILANSSRFANIFPSQNFPVCGIFKALTQCTMYVYSMLHHAAGIAGGNRLNKVMRKLVKEVVKVPPVKTHCPASMV